MDDPQQINLVDHPNGGSAVIADDELLRLYDFPSGVARALDEDGVVLIGDRHEEGTATVTLVNDGSEFTDGGSPTGQTLVPPFQVDVVASPGLPMGSIPGILMTPERVRELGVEPNVKRALLRAPSPLSDADRAALQIVSEDYHDAVEDARQPGGEILTVQQQLTYSGDGPSPRLLEGLLSAAALVVGMFVVAVSLALAAAETRDERDVLAVVGAPPSTMRRASGGKALLLTFLGAVLAVPVGFLPVAVFTAADPTDLPLVFPWRTVVLLVVGVPLVAALVTTLFSGLALRLRPVRVSTMAFD